MLRLFILYYVQISVAVGKKIKSNKVGVRGGGWGWDTVKYILFLWVSSCVRVFLCSCSLWFWYSKCSPHLEIDIERLLTLRSFTCFVFKNVHGMSFVFLAQKFAQKSGFFFLCKCIYIYLVRCTSFYLHCKLFIHKCIFVCLCMYKMIIN